MAVIASAMLFEPSVPPVYRRCILTDDGAVGLVPSPKWDESRNPPWPTQTFRVVFESHDGKSVLSEEHEVDPPPDRRVSAPPPEDLLVFPPPNAIGAPVTFVKLATRLEPVPLSRPVPAQTAEFFSPIARISMPYVWTEITRTQGKGYLLSFRLPDLRWTTQFAYGNSRDSSLAGVEARVFLDAGYALAPKADLRAAVKEACPSVPPVDRASPAMLWASAQCQRVRGEPVAIVLAHVAKRCEVLAGQVLPISRAAADLRERERNGDKIPPWKGAELEEKLRILDPPTACFEGNAWNQDYTGRSGPITLPKVALESGWKAGLDALGTWP